jgi:hypothetical protein
MKKVSLILVGAMILSLFPAMASAQFKPGSGEIKGYMIGEYYYNASHHTEEGQGRHGFWFRRIYFTYNNKLSDTVKMRFRLETASPGQWATSALLIPFVKDAYLSWKFAGSSSLVAGIQSPPSFAQVEGIWGYRSLEKTPLDLYRWTSSRDFGITLKGGTDILYHVMVGNGSSNKGEINEGKKAYGALGYTTGGFFIEAMTQYERAKTGDNDIIGQVFGAYSGDWGRIGLQYAYRSYQKEGSDETLPYNVASVFAVFKASPQIDLIARWDYNFGDGYQQSFSGNKIAFIPFAPDHEFNFIIAALSWQAHKNVWIIPNIKYATYSENDLLKEGEDYEKPGDDLYTNLTLWFKF